MSLTDEFGFNARQYFDFRKEQDDVTDDSFFEIASQDSVVEPNSASKDVVERVEVSDTESDVAYFSPMDNTRNAGISGATMYLERDNKVRKSLSMSNLASGSQLLTSMEESNTNEPERPSSSCTYNPKKRWMSKENINRLAQPKLFTSSDKGRFTSLAEAVNQFQAATPTRFRSKSSQKLSKVGTTTSGCTKPNSPKLTTAARARPLSVTAISRDERERLEMEEAKKFKIRANPVNKKAMKGPLKAQTEKKAPTIIEPFDLTQIKKKEMEVVNNPPVFKAQPLPKSLYKPFKIQDGVAQPTTKAQSPNIKKVAPKYTPKKVNSEEKKSERASRLTVTRPKPFKFEERNQQLIKKKEEFINKVLEEEKKAREFHAKPAPKGILKARNCSADRMSTVSSKKNSMGSAEELEITFRARPATVLKIKPFEPKKDETHVLVTEAFRFSTDERVDARHKFEQQLKEKEQMVVAFEKQREEMLRREEEEKVAQLRKLAEHKAQPIRKYKELVIKPSNKVTQPISPVFHTDRIRNKENLGE